LSAGFFRGSAAREPFFRQEKVMSTVKTRVDLHVHSKYSDRPSEWILRRMGAPESFVEPLDIYHRARQRGMKFVTISDHNCISGALDIAHLPGTFLSTEVTTYFPEDGCKVHCLISGISEQQFAMIQEVRQSIYEFRQYVLDEDIIRTVAHPLYRVNDQLTVEHLEKLLVMFNRFEGINGTRDPRASELTALIFRQLTPEMLADMADRHAIDPVGEQPWLKTFTGGSDDHSGIYIASAYTQTPAADSVDEYLEHLREGRHEMGGSSGTSLRLAHSFYHIAYDYYKSRLLGGSLARRNFIDELFRRVIEGHGSPRLSFRDRLRYLARRITARARGTHVAEQTLVDELTHLLAQPEQDSLAAPAARDDQHSFATACRVCHLVSYEFFRKFMRYAGEGRLVDSLQTVASLGPVALSMAPYLAAFHTQHKDERFLQAVASYFPASRDRVRKSERKAWVTDTFADVNGVSLMIRCLGAEAKRQGRELTIVTGVEQLPETDLNVRNFPPVGSFSLPEYESQTLGFPPFLEVIEYLERERFGELIISTPGPLGLTALAAGRLLGIPLTGIYHTDFPKYVRFMTQDEALEQLTWRYMHWFYDQMQTIYVPSEFYRRQLADNGFDARKLQVLKRGVDVARFSPHKRDSAFWRRRGARQEFTFLYVGRASKEKNLDLLLSSFEGLLERGMAANLAIVGDGPHLRALRDRYRRPEVLFTGYLDGEELAQAFSSADVFVFPSTTDTFGNVVLEAQASGLAAIVSNQGGPAELVEHRGTGLVFDAAEPDSLAAAMSTLRGDDALRTRLGQAAVRTARLSSWIQVLDHLMSQAPLADAAGARQAFHRIRAGEHAAALVNMEVS
jgi:glycosyltransferase involved in cell wall biosynthesis